MINPVIPERTPTFGTALYPRCTVWTLMSLLPMFGTCILAAFHVYPPPLISLAPLIVYCVVAALFQQKVTTSFPNRICTTALSYFIFCTTLTLMIITLSAYRGEHPALSNFIRAVTGLTPAPIGIALIWFYVPMPILLLGPAVFVAVLRNFIGPSTKGYVTELGCGQHKELQGTVLAPPAIPAIQANNE